MRKKQNVRTPMLEAVASINSYGIEVVARIILGLDTDRSETTDAIVEFMQALQVPILTPSLLVALSHAPFHERPEKANRLNSGERRDSNIQYLQPYEDVVANWEHVIRETCEPQKIYERYAP